MNAFTALHPLASLIMLGIFSLAIGSVLNVVIYRIPLMLKAAFTAECRQVLHLPAEPIFRVNLFIPRSFCPACKALIHAWNNIPLLSYALLRGRCATCRAPIPWRYPIVEAVCMVLSIIAGIRYGFTPTLLFALLFIWLVLCLCIIDLQHQLLPDSLTLSLLWLGLIANTQGLFTTLPDAVLSTVGAYVGLWLFVTLFYFITGKVGMGRGDLKLFAAFGAWFGWTQLPFILFIASLAGAVIGIIYLKATGQTRETPIPFGPFLCMAGLISLFYGSTILHLFFIPMLK